MRSKGTASSTQTVRAESTDLDATQATDDARPTTTGEAGLRDDDEQHELAALFRSNTVCCSIQRDVDLCKSPAAAENMVNRLWEIFDTDADNIHEHATRQLSDIMRLLEIHWELHCNSTQFQN